MENTKQPETKVQTEEKKYKSVWNQWKKTCECQAFCYTPEEAKIVVEQESLRNILRLRDGLQDVQYST